MIFPMDNSNSFSSAGGHTGSPLEHCVDNVNEVQDVPFPKHFPNQPGQQGYPPSSPGGSGELPR